jgi:hypothetical protein
MIAPRSLVSGVGKHQLAIDRDEHRSITAINARSTA